VAGCCECGDEPSDSGATELVRDATQNIYVMYGPDEPSCE
jgi:hypothetical protein